MQLSKLAREARNAYLREWRKNNREKASQTNNRYWERKAREMQTKKATETKDE